MIDERKQVVEHGGNTYTVTTVPRRAWAMLVSRMMQADADQARLMDALYSMLPYFVESATVAGHQMPEPENTNRDGYYVRMASGQWLSENVPPEDLPAIEQAMQECNKLGSDAVNFTSPEKSPSTRRKKTGTA